MEDQIYLSSEFEKFWIKILAGDNFAFMRYGDGERAIMEGRSVTAQEGWKSPNYISRLGVDSLRSLMLTDSNVWYGISCPCCDSAAYYWYLSRIPSRNITFANLWVNHNYNRFINEFKKLARDAVVIANYRAEGKPIGSLNILKYYSVDDDCVKFWDTHGSNLVSEIINEFGHRDNILYVVSAGPLSGPIISELYRNNPNNCYIDFGSAIDTYIHNKVTRPYMRKGTHYSQKECWMYNPKTINTDVTVVLNLYKRPDNLKKQIDAINIQTLKPKEIILYQDGISDEYIITLLPEIKDKFDFIRVSSENGGVWKRFEFAKDMANCPYVCLFDDDTIPGNRWIENCFKCMQDVEGVYGTVGIVMHHPKYYPYHGFVRVGWPGPLSKRVSVDFVGHSWFIKKEWLNFMFDGTENFQEYKYVAEDMCLSVQCQRHGIKTYIPPHPCDNHDYWGSLPEFARKLGKTENAVSSNNLNYRMMNSAIAEFIDGGWKLVANEKRFYTLSLIGLMLLEQFLGRSKSFILFLKKLIKSILPKKICI